MEILYISSVPSKNQFEYLKKKLRPNIDVAKYGMQESGFKFHTLIQEGFIANNHNVYSLIGRPTSVKSHKNFIWKKKIEREKQIIYDHVGYLNIPIIKNIIISMLFFLKTIKWINKNKNNKKTIIIDAAYVTAIPFVVLATKFKKCNKIAVVCDIYEYMSNVKDARDKSNRAHKIISKMMAKVYKQIEGFVLLTDAMNAVINKSNKPYIIMEGLVDNKIITSKNELSEKNKKDVIMYAGAIRSQYGLKNLIEGFNNYKNDNAELWICGAGDFVETIKLFSKKDKRIKYKGLLSIEEIIEMEKKATLLINPRSANQEFTKYSFPSKNMEYMASATPVLTTCLPGMPHEYYKYVYTIDGDTADDISKALSKTLDISREILHKKGLKAKEFVINCKNNIHQTRRIIDLGRRIINDEDN